MRTESIRIADEKRAIVFNASDKQVAITRDHKKHHLHQREWMNIDKTLDLAGKKISVTADQFYCVFELDGDLHLESYPLIHPPKGEASMFIIHAGAGCLTAKARYGDTFPTLDPGSCISPLTLYVPMDIVIDFYKHTEKPKVTYHYVTEKDQVGILIYSGSCLYFIEICPAH